MKEFENCKLFDGMFKVYIREKIEELLDGLNICDNIGCTTDHRVLIDEAYYRIEHAIRGNGALYAFNKRKN